MTRSTRISQFTKQDLWSRDLTTMSWLRRMGTQALRLATAVGMEFRHRLLDARAAARVNGCEESRPAPSSSPT